MSAALPEEWLVAFGDRGGSPPWWMRWTRPGFRHVLAFRYQAEFDIWLVVEPGFEGVSARVVAPAEIDHLVAVAKLSGGEILKWRVRERAVLRRPLLFVTCVGAVARLLGVRAGCALSPWALYRKLLRMGAEPAFSKVA